MMTNADILKTFKGKKILVVGDVMADHYLNGNVERISPEAPVPVVNIHHEEFRLGGAANVALNIQELGGIATVASVIGNDEVGKKIKSLLKKNKIGITCLVESKSRQSTIKSRIISKQHQMIRFDREQTNDLNDTELKSLHSSIEKILKREMFDGVVMEDYNKGTLTSKNISSLIALFNKYKLPIAVDPKKNNFLEYKQVTLFKPNLREMQEAMKQPLPSNLPSLSDAAKWLNKKLKNKITIITLGDKGIFFHQQKTTEIKAAEARNVSDVSGAGDTVIAVLSLALAANLSIQSVLSLSNLAGGLVCEQSGVVPVTIQMINKATDHNN